MSELTESDRQHLDLLRIFHFVKAGLWAMGCLAGGLYIFMGSFVGRAMEEAGPQPGGAPSPEQISAIMGGIGVVVVLLSLAGAALCIYAAQCIRDRRNRTLLMVLSAFHLLSFPFGTALGAFTLIVLVRPTVSAAFQQKLK